jgi:hypothetical protein
VPRSRSEQMVDAFEYPQSPHVRRHGPDGYTTHESYRPWLRDEFCFRCVLCLHREKWPTTSTFEIDHLLPVSERPDLECRYSNLLYVCRRCNNLKTDLPIPDPCSIAYGSCLRVNADGTIEAINDVGHTLVLSLRLDRPERVRQRRLIIETLSGIQKAGNARQLHDWLGFPEELEDLRMLKPPTNDRLEGIEQSWFARRARGELPEIY